LLELPSQMFFQFASVHNNNGFSHSLPACAFVPFSKRKQTERPVIRTFYPLTDPLSIPAA
jgi:hypothetical protein